MIAVSVIVPAFDASATLGATLDALARQALAEPFEVIVVDDGSRDSTFEIAEQAQGNVSVLRQENQGPGPARNSGVRHAQGEALAFTDADCVPEREWLREGLAALRGADLVQGRVRPDPAAVRRPFDRTIWVSGQHGLFETANMFVTRELFDRLGGFEVWLQARVGKPLAEDAWFGWRARRAGARTAFCERATVNHAVFPRTARAYAAERLRLAYFPAMVARMPELRQGFLFRRSFLSPRSAAFDAALAGLAVAVAVSRISAIPRTLAIVPLLLGLPYVRLAARSSLPWGRAAPKVALVDAAADLVGLAALVSGSARWRAPVL